MASKWAQDIASELFAPGVAELSLTIEDRVAQALDKAFADGIRGVNNAMFGPQQGQDADSEWYPYWNAMANRIERGET